GAPRGRGARDVRALLLLTRLRLLDVLRSRASAGFMLVFPVALLLVSGVVFLEGHPFERRTLVVVDEARPGEQRRAGHARPDARQRLALGADRLDADLVERREREA